MGLMCDRRLDFAALDREFGCDVTNDYAREIAGLADLGGGRPPGPFGGGD